MSHDMMLLDMMLFNNNNNDNMPKHIKLPYKDKIYIRRQIEILLDEYKADENSEYLLKAAVLRGLYTANGGKKGYSINPKYQFITYNCHIVFSYMLKIDNNRNNTRAVKELADYVDRVTHGNHDQSFNIGYNSYPTTSNDIGRLIAYLCFYNHLEDIELNRVNVAWHVAGLLKALRRKDGHNV